MFIKIAKSNWLKIVLFITTFAFVGTGFVALVVYKFSGQISGVAQVNGEEITQQEFIYEVSQVEAQYQNQGVDVSPIRKMIYAQVLDNLINRQLLYQFAKEEGIDATKEEVKKLILDIPAFQKDGKFNKQIFLGFLQSMNISPQLFEEIIKKQLSVQHVFDLLKAGFYITDDEIDIFLKKRLSAVDGKVVTIKPAVDISENEIKEYYEKNKDKFSIKTGKKIKIYEIDVSNTEVEKANQIAQNLYKKLTSGILPEEKEGVKIIFDDIFLKDKEKSIPEIVLKDLNKLSKDKKVLFIKDKDKYYLVYYEKDESIPMTLQQARAEIEKILKEEKTKKTIEKIKAKLEKEKSFDLKQLKEKYNAKVEEIKNKKYMQLQFEYGLSPENADKIVKNGKGFSKPYIAKGKIVIFYIENIIPPSKEEYTKAKQQLKPLFENQKFNDIVSMLIEKLKNEADIKVNNRVLE